MIQPLDDRILLERVDPPETRTGSGLIIIPEVAQDDRVRRGKVLATGPGAMMKGGWRRPVDVRPGDIVMYQSSDLDDGRYILIMEGDILGVVGQ